MSDRERLASLLTGHAKRKRHLCSCGWVDLSVPPSVTWEQHVADVVLAALTPSTGPAADDPLPEVQCPSCGATIRARMSDQ